MKGDLDLTFDDLINALKEINLSYEKLLSSNQQLQQGVKRVSIAEDSKEALKNVQRVLNSLEKFSRTINTIEEAENNTLNKES